MMEEKSSLGEEGADDISYASGESASETEDAEIATSKDEDEIDLEDIASNDDYTQENPLSSISEMIWSSAPSHTSKLRFLRNVTVDSGPTVFIKHVSSVEDAFLSFMSKEIMNNILFYSNMEGNRNNVSDDKWENITIIELKQFIGL
ncbi:unnamed protein product [Rotaria sp. Silwood2]|nr:unnamed protein product [Rotaria sp. Silwood2]CAF2911299.1 unnamed protein product [Rotaria sp. Silwood2]CAF3196247.1 unnamed protein product [Rotaria sp. Silwood2]CAF3198761.1 unnamed protein product [Rotaria sp. Silwood2]CAF3953810.1 unnamed protein product [Rotaria sp. Silwood2]